MKIIKFKKNKSFSYKRSVIINDLLLNISVGIHKFEKKNKQRVKFNLKINTDSSQVPDDSDLSSIINYEEVINIIKKITNRKHYPLLETLAEKILSKLFENNKIKKVIIKIEKIDILENTCSVGIEIKKTKINES